MYIVLHGQLPVLHRLYSVSLPGQMTPYWFGSGLEQVRVLD